jgi:hypothetical protein
MSRNNFVVSLYSGDTLLDVYGYIDRDEPSVGHVGGVDIEDVCIADTEISVLEMIIGLGGWDKFQESVDEAYASRNDA